MRGRRRSMREVRIVERVAARVRLVAILDRGELQDVVVVDVPVDLGHPVRIIEPVLAPALVGGGTGRNPGRQHFGALAALLLRVRVEEQAVLDQRTADVSAHQGGPAEVLVAVLAQRAVGPLVGGARAGIDGGAVRQLGRAIDRIPAGIGVVDVTRRRAGALGDDEGVDPALPFVGAALGDEIDDAARGPAEFRTVTAGQDLLLGYRVERQAGEADRGERIGDVVAVDEIGVFGRGRATEAGHAAVAVVADHAGSKQRHFGDRAADRELAQLLGGQHGAGIGLRHVDGGDHAAHDRHGIEGLGAVAGRCTGERHVRTAGDVDGDVVAHGEGLAIFLQGDLVPAVRQGGDAVAAIGVDRDSARLPGAEILDDDRCTRGTRRLAEDAAGDIGLGVDRAGDAQTQRERERGTPQRSLKTIATH